MKIYKSKSNSLLNSLCRFAKKNPRQFKNIVISINFIFLTIFALLCLIWFTSTKPNLIKLANLQKQYFSFKIKEVQKENQEYINNQEIYKLLNIDSDK